MADIWTQNLNYPSNIGTQESAENDTDFQKYVAQMKSDYDSKIKALENMFDNLGNTGDQPAGEVDTASLMILINKNAAEIKNRATNTDLESLRK